MTKEEFDVLYDKWDSVYYRKVALREFAKRLMVGDYYYDRFKDVYRRVTLDTFYMIKNGDLDIGTEPILLTKDILERNGFHIGNGVASKCWGDCVDGDVFDYMVSCDFCMDGVVEYIHIRVPYIEIEMSLDKVNEFLHALRLCGLGEMADEFKL